MLSFALTVGSAHTRTEQAWNKALRKTAHRGTVCPGPGVAYQEPAK